MIQIHPRSLLVGLVLGAIALLTMSQSLAPSTATVRVQYMPHPREIVRVTEGQAFVVPAGKILICTQVAAQTFIPATTRAIVTIDGIELLDLACDNATYRTTELVAGLRADANATVTVEALGAGEAILLGYLADQ